MGSGSIFAGHGSIGTGEVVIPEGTALTLHGRHGFAITDSVGTAIESGATPLLEGSTTFLPGARVPNYILHPGPDLTILPGSLTVSSPTALRQLLRPNMGLCQWAACRGPLAPPAGKP